MRRLEILLVLLLGAAAGCRLASNRHHGILVALLGFGMAALVLHLIFEGAHWQMAPAYFGVSIFSAIAIWTPRTRIPDWGLLACVLAACVLSALLPMFRLPQPTGPRPIGTKLFHLIDADRREEADPGHPRELMVQIWYPAAPSRNARAAYRRFAETTPLSAYQSVLPTHARWNPPPAAGGEVFPVLLFHPSWEGRRTQNMYLVEELVSHGFVVAGIDHTYNSALVAFPGGRLVRRRTTPDMQDFAHGAIERVRTAGEMELEIQTADNRFVLDRLEAMNADCESPFHGRLNIEKTGAFGHSFGGAVAAQTSAEDPRIRCALDLDGSLFGSVARDGLPKPFMFIEQEIPDYTSIDLSRLAPPQSIEAALNMGDNEMFAKFGGYRLFLRGSTHLSYTDRPIFSPFRFLSGKERLSPGRQRVIVRDYALAFFNKVLKGMENPLLTMAPSPYPEVRIEIRLFN